MKKILVLFLSLGYYYLSGQMLAPPDTSYTDSSINKYLNQSFIHFKYNPTIDSLEKALGTKLDNVISCLLIIAIASEEHLFELAEKNMILERLRELSEKLFYQTTHIILLDSGSNSIELAKTLNTEKKEKFL